MVHSNKFNQQKNVKTHRVGGKEEKKAPEVINNQKFGTPVDKEMADAIRIANSPVRCVLYVEVGGMDGAYVAHLIGKISESYQGASSGVHYVIPVRNGKLTSEVEFEGEFLKTVQALCEVKDNQIVMRGDSTDVRVIRGSV